MSYNYQTEKQSIFTEKGQIKFTKIRDHVKSLLCTAGAVREREALSGALGSS